MSKDIVTPLHLSAAYQFDSLEEGTEVFSTAGAGYAYNRMGNKNVTLFEQMMTALEYGEPFAVKDEFLEKYENRAWATNSGLTALMLLVFGLTHGKEGKKRRIVTSPCIYGGSYHQLQLLAEGHGIQAVFVKNPHDFASWREAINEDTAFVFLETPANPNADIFDIQAIARIAHSAGTVLVVDGTLGVTLQYPLALGADAVLHSATKALNRQSTGLGGIIVGSRDFIVRHEAVLNDYLVSLGAIMYPQSAWFILNNRFTLERDMAFFSGNALRVATFLARHGKVKKVNHPVLHGDEMYSLHGTQMPRGIGGVFSFEMNSYDEAKRFVESVTKSENVYLAPHLGDVRYLMIHPASTTHAKLTEVQMREVNITPELVRFSVGLGDPAPVLEDLSAALKNL
ncbi:MAG: aminotransferase class V-fold PLP-dependent enzyme [Parcubacteria group bacterium]|nr:aminotransferase class V-fold PLP-dependent enzyme [Parcubacteria group bacterium]